MARDTEPDELTPVQVPNPNLVKRSRPGVPTPPPVPKRPSSAERRMLKAVELTTPMDYMVTFPDGSSVIFRNGQPLLVRTKRPVVVTPMET